jgi:small subunit ribosomal protein S16
MLVIRMQRTGRKGHALFRVVVQDVRQTPSSGLVVASLGTYDPHTKAANIDVDKAKFYLKNGAQPSGRVVALLKEAGVKLPDWVEASPKKTRSIRNADKLRKNRPAEEKPAKEAEVPAEIAEVVDTAPEQVAEEAEPQTEVAETVEEPVVTEDTPAK